jgi:hypothetical protein
MRYVIDESNYVKAISFGTTMEYNECVCVEYTGPVPSGWNDLEAWYFDEGNKLWRWQIIDGELVMDESATAPQEGNWMGVVVSDPVIVKTPSGSDSTSIIFDLPDGTENLCGFFVLLNGRTSLEYDSTPYCVSLRVSVDENVIDVVFSYTDRMVEHVSSSGCFELRDNSVEVNVYGVKSADGAGGFFRKNTEYALYPFYSR